MLEPRTPREDTATASRLNARRSASMFDFGIGVNAVSAYEVKRVDSDFFSEE